MHLGTAAYPALTRYKAHHAPARFCLAAPSRKSTPKKSEQVIHTYSDLVGEGGFEPPKSVTTDLQSAPFGRSGIPPYEILELVDGFEPPTC